MSLLKRIEEELSGFTQFGGIMTEKLRNEAAEMLLQYLFDPDYEAIKNLDSSQIHVKYPNWYGLLHRLFSHGDLRKLTRNNEDLSFSIAKDTLQWCKRISQQFEANHDHFQEERELDVIQQNPRLLDAGKWEDILTRLSDYYPSHRQSWEFYKTALADNQRKLSSAGEDRHFRIERDIDVLHENILEDWSRFFFNKKHTLEEEFLDQAFSQYTRELTRKVAQLNDLGDLLAPFYNFLGHVWNDSLGAWDRVDWDKLEEYAKSLQRDSQLRELAELLGRWKSAEKQVEEYKLQQPVPEKDWKPNPYGKSEIIGIHYSDDISSMLPAEVALLSSPETELILSKKFVEKKLLTFQYRSRDIGSSLKKQEEVSMLADSDEKGPIIMAIDTSGSMFGAPERIAKALALAILEIALKQKRRAYLISFSTGIKTAEMTGMEEQLDSMVEFLRMSFHGGTDIQPALEETLEVLEQEEYEKADVLVISDFVIPRIDRKMFESIQHLRQEKGISFHSLFITRRHDPRIPPLPIFDNHWVYDLENPKVMRQMVDHFEELAGEK